jgi:hypothetical protein
MTFRFISADSNIYRRRWENLKIGIALVLKNKTKYEVHENPSMVKCMSINTNGKYNIIYVYNEVIKYILLPDFKFLWWPP